MASILIRVQAMVILTTPDIVVHDQNPVKDLANSLTSVIGLPLLSANGQTCVAEVMMASLGKAALKS